MNVFHHSIMYVHIHLITFSIVNMYRKIDSINNRKEEKMKNIRYNLSQFIIVQIYTEIISIEKLYFIYNN